MSFKSAAELILDRVRRTRNSFATQLEQEIQPAEHWKERLNQLFASVPVNGDGRSIYLRIGLHKDKHTDLRALVDELQQSKELPNDVRKELLTYVDEQVKVTWDHWRRLRLERASLADRQGKLF